MSANPFHPPFERLPATLPLFPLSGAVVMPGCQLPLNIFEPRYLNMVFDAMGSERLIGMMQVEPAGPVPQGSKLYAVGTAGRIVSLSETQDGRLLIVLSGVCRYRLSGEIPTTRGYRRATVDWEPYRIDYDADQTMNFPRERQRPARRSGLMQCPGRRDALGSGRAPGVARGRHARRAGRNAGWIAALRRGDRIIRRRQSPLIARTPSQLACRKANRAPQHDARAPA